MANGLLRPTAPTILSAEEEKEQKYNVRDQVRIEREVPRLQKLTERKLERLELARQRSREMSSNFDDSGLDLGDLAKTTFDFVIGDDLQLLGFHWDNGSFEWSMEHAKHVWSEDPLWINMMRGIGLGTAFLPIVAGVNKSLKVGKLGQKFKKGYDFVDYGEDLGMTTAFKGKWFQLFPDEAAERSFLATRGFNNLTKSGLKTARIAVRREMEDTKKVVLGKAIAAGKETFKWGGEDVTITPLMKARNKIHKEFANSYFNITNSTKASVFKEYHTYLNDVSGVENIGKFFSTIPDEFITGDVRLSTKLLRYWNDPDNFPIDELPTHMRDWADGVGVWLKQHNKDMFDLGVIDEVTFKKIPVHTPFQIKGTPLPATRKGLRKTSALVREAKQGSSLEYIQWPDLDSLTLKLRRKQWPETLRILDEMDEAAVAGTKAATELIVDPMEVTLRGLFVDRQLYHNFKFIRDFVKDQVDKGFGYTDQVAKEMLRSGKSLSGYLDMNHLPANHIMTRILDKHYPELITNGRLPWIPKEMINEIFGPMGIMEQTNIAADVIGAMTA